MIKTKTIQGKPVLAMALLALLMLLRHGASAQTPNYLAELGKINNTYDSAVYLSFHVRYMYRTDTVSNRSKNSDLDGDYYLNGRKAYYRVGNIEYMRNDSFLISVYNENKFLMVSQINGSGNRSSATLPVKAILDSIFLGMSSHYNITGTTRWERGDSIRYMYFKRLPGDSAAPYDYFTLSYYSRSHFIRSLEYGFRQYMEKDEHDTSSGQAPLPGAGSTAISDVPKKWHVRFSILFENYRMSALDPKIFSETRFITPIGANKWDPVERYNGYKIYLNTSH